MTPQPREPACARCAQRLGASCCEPGPGGHLATLTLADVARIAAATGRQPETFCDVEVLTADEAEAYGRRRPAYAGYFASSDERLTLRLSAAGACVLHDAARGCSLGASERPLACRLYPFEPLSGPSEMMVLAGRFDSLAEAREAQGEACLAVQESSSMASLRRALGTTRAELDGLVARLRDDVADHARRSAGMAASVKRQFAGQPEGVSSPRRRRGVGRPP